MGKRTHLEFLHLPVTRRAGKRVCNAGGTREGGLWRHLGHWLDSPFPRPVLKSYETSGLSGRSETRPIHRTAHRHELDTRLRDLRCEGKCPYARVRREVRWCALSEAAAVRHPSLPHRSSAGTAQSTCTCERRPQPALEQHPGWSTRRMGTTVRARNVRGESNKFKVQHSWRIEKRSSGA